MRSALMVLCVALSACLPLPEPEPVPPTDCERACDNFAALGCPEAEPTPEGATCVEVCANMRASNLPVPAACWARAEDCDSATMCGMPPEDATQ